MKSLTQKKGLSLGLSFLLIISTVLPPLAEASIWEDRRAQKEPVQLARLPAALSRPLPMVRPQIDQTLSPVTSQQFEKISSRLQPILKALPLTRVRVGEWFDPRSSQGAPVLILQDIHLNPEAQENAAQALQALLNQDAASVIGVEGAFGHMDFSPFRLEEERPFAQEAADDFLKAGLLAAPSYVAVTSPRPLPLFLGVDDEKLHQENVAVFLETRSSKDAVQKKLATQAQELNERKKTLFDSTLLSFDHLQTEYHQGKLSIGAFVRQLAQFEPAPTLALDQFIEALRLEQKINFSQADRERGRVIQKLAERLSPSQLEQLAEGALAHQAGKITFGDFYARLKTLCVQADVPLASHPAFNDYVQYVLLAEGIDGQTLYSDLNAWEEKTANKLIRTEEERKLYDESERLRLASRLVDFELTPMEWEKYQKGLGSRGMGHGSQLVIPAKAGIQKQESAQRKTLDSRLRGNDGYDLSIFERFYEIAHARSEVMIESLIKEKASKARVLVTGGFHSPDIAAYLKEKTIPYVIVTPKISKVDANAESYLSFFAQEKTPIEKLFQREKIFVSPAGVQATHEKIGLPLLARIKSAAQGLNPVPLIWKGISYTATLPQNLRDLSRYLLKIESEEEREQRLAETLKRVQEGEGYKADLRTKAFLSYARRLPQEVSQNNFESLTDLWGEGFFVKEGEFLIFLIHRLSNVLEANHLLDEKDQTMKEHVDAVGHALYEIAKNAERFSEDFLIKNDALKDPMTDPVANFDIRLIPGGAGQPHVIEISNPGEIDSRAFSLKRLKRLKEYFKIIHVDGIMSGNKGVVRDDKELKGYQINKRALHATDAINHIFNVGEIIDAAIEKLENKEPLTSQDIQKLIETPLITANPEDFKRNYFIPPGKTEEDVHSSYGRGIGVALAVNELKGIGGDLKITSQNNVTTFRLEFPSDVIQIEELKETYAAEGGILHFLRNNLFQSDFGREAYDQKAYFLEGGAFIFLGTLLGVGLFFGLDFSSISAVQWGAVLSMTSFFVAHVIDVSVLNQRREFSMRAPPKNIRISAQIAGITLLFLFLPQLVFFIPDSAFFSSLSVALGHLLTHQRVNLFYKRAREEKISALKDKSALPKTDRQYKDSVLNGSVETDQLYYLQYLLQETLPDRDYALPSINDPAGQSFRESVGYAIYETLKNARYRTELYLRSEGFPSPISEETILDSVWARVLPNHEAETLSIEVSNPGAINLKDFSLKKLKTLLEYHRALRRLLETDTVDVIRDKQSPLFGYGFNENLSYYKEGVRSDLTRSIAILNSLIQKLEKGNQLNLTDFENLITSPFITSQVEKFKSMFFTQEGQAHAPIPSLANEGVGVGLAKTKEFLEQGGMSLTLESKEDRTFFTVDIPLSLLTPQENDAAEPESQPRWRSQPREEEKALFKKYGHFANNVHKTTEIDINRSATPGKIAFDTLITIQKIAQENEADISGIHNQFLAFLLNEVIKNEIDEYIREHEDETHEDAVEHFSVKIHETTQKNPGAFLLEISVPSSVDLEKVYDLLPNVLSTLKEFREANKNNDPRIIFPLPTSALSELDETISAIENVLKLERSVALKFIFPLFILKFFTTKLGNFRAKWLREETDRNSHVYGGAGVGLHTVNYWASRLNLIFEYDNEEGTNTFLIRIPFDETRKAEKFDFSQEIPTHWSSAWKEPTANDFKEAEEALHYMERLEIKPNLEGVNGNTYLTDTRIGYLTDKARYLRVYYWLYPDLAAALLFSAAQAPEELKKFLALSEIEPSLLAAIAQRGVSWIDKEKDIPVGKQKIYIPFNLEPLRKASQSLDLQRLISIFSSVDQSTLQNLNLFLESEQMNAPLEEENLISLLEKINLPESATGATPSSEGGLIGHYEILSTPEYLKDEQSLQFQARNLKPGKDHLDEEITVDLDVRLATYEDFSRLFTLSGEDNDPITKKIFDLLNKGKFKGQIFVFTDLNNEFGIKGIGTPAVIAVSQGLIERPLALFHELAEAFVSAGALTLSEIESALSPEAKDWYLKKIKEGENKKIQAHYAIRALQKQNFPDLDRELTETIQEKLTSNEIEAYLNARVIPDKNRPLNLFLDKEPQEMMKGKGRSMELLVLNQIVELEKGTFPPDLSNHPQAEEKVDALLSLAKWAFETIDWTDKRPYQEILLGLFEDLVSFDQNMVNKKLIPILLRDTTEPNPLQAAILKFIAILLPEERRASFLTAFASEIFYSEMASARRHYAVEDWVAIFAAAKTLPRHLNISILDALMDPLNEFYLEDVKFAHSGLDQFEESFRSQFFLKTNTKGTYALHPNAEVNIFSLRDLELKEAFWRIYKGATVRRDAIRKILSIILSRDQDRRLAQIILDRIKKKEFTLKTRGALMEFIPSLFIPLQALGGLIPVRESIQEIHKAFSLAKTVGQKNRLINTFWDFMNGIDFNLEDVAFSKKTYASWLRKKALDLKEPMRKLSGQISLLQERAQEPETTLSEEDSRLIVEWERQYLTHYYLLERILFLLSVETVEQEPKDQKDTLAFINDIFRGKEWPVDARNAAQRALLLLNSQQNSDLVNSFFNGAKKNRKLIFNLASQRNTAPSLTDLIFDESQPAPSRLTAFNLYLNSHFEKSPGEEDEPKKDPRQDYRSLMDALAPESIAYIKRNLTSPKNIRAFLRDFTLRDEEARTFLSALLIAFEKIDQPYDFETVQKISNRIEYTKVFDFMNNALSNFQIGVPLINKSDNPAFFFFFVMAHEMEHNVLDFDLGIKTDQIHYHIIHEFMADLAALALMEFFSIPIPSYEEILKFSKNYTDLQDSNFIAINGHEGGQAQLFEIIKEIEAKKGTFSPLKFYRHAKSILRKTRKFDNVEDFVQLTYFKFVGEHPLKEDPLAKRTLTFSKAMAKAGPPKKKDPFALPSEQVQQKILRSRHQRRPSSSGGLIGHFKIINKPTLTPQKGSLSFSGMNLETGKKEDVTLLARQANSTERRRLVESFPASSHVMVQQVAQWLENFDGDLYFITDAKNSWGIKGLGTKNWVALTEDLKETPLAFFHEVAEAMGAAGDLTVDMIRESLNRDQLQWLDQKLEEGARNEIALHYAIRALQRQEFPVLDKNLTEKIQNFPNDEDALDVLQMSELTYLQLKDAPAGVRYRSVAALLEKFRSSPDQNLPILIVDRLLEDVDDTDAFASFLASHILPFLSQKDRERVIILLAEVISDTQRPARERHAFLQKWLGLFKDTVVISEDALEGVTNLFLRFINQFLDSNIAIPRNKIPPMTFHDLLRLFIRSDNASEREFHPDFEKRLSKVRNLELRKTLWRLYKERAFERDAIHEMTNALTLSHSKSKFPHALLDKAEEGLIRPEALATLLIKTPVFSETKNISLARRVISVLPLAYQQTLDPQKKQALSRVLVETLQNNPTLRLKDDTLLWVKEAIEKRKTRVANSANRVKFRQEKMKKGDKINAEDARLLEVEENAYHHHLESIDNFLAVLTLASINDLSRRQSLISFLTSIYESDDWALDLRVSAQRNLAAFLSLGDETVQQWFKKHVSQERKDLLEVAIDANQPDLLKARLKNSRAFSTPTKLLAFNAYIAQNAHKKDFDSDEMARFKIELKEEAWVWIQNVIRQDERMDRILSDPILQEEEIKAALTGLTLILESFTGPLSDLSFSLLMKDIHHGSRILQLRNNANSELSFGVPVLNKNGKPASTFFQIAAHEMAHNVLDHETSLPSDTLRGLLIHEFMADLAAFAITEEFSLDRQPYLDVVDYARHHKDVAENDLNAVESHEGARAQLTELWASLNELEIEFVSALFLNAGLKTIQNSSGHFISFEEFLTFTLGQYLNNPPTPQEKAALHLSQIRQLRAQAHQKSDPFELDLNSIFEKILPSPGLSKTIYPLLSAGGILYFFRNALPEENGWRTWYDQNAFWVEALIFGVWAGVLFSGFYFGIDLSDIASVRWAAVLSMVSFYAAHEVDVRVFNPQRPENLRAPPQNATHALRIAFISTFFLIIPAPAQIGAALVFLGHLLTHFIENEKAKNNLLDESLNFFESSLAKILTIPVGLFLISFLTYPPALQINPNHLFRIGILFVELTVFLLLLFSPPSRFSFQPFSNLGKNFSLAFAGLSPQAPLIAFQDALRPNKNQLTSSKTTMSAPRAREEDPDLYEYEQGWVEKEEEEEVDPIEDLLLLEADFGFLPPSHPYLQLIEERLEKLLPGLDVEGWPKVRILGSRGEGVNASAFSDGTIVIHPEMLELLDYVEELDALLLHEINHWVKKHHKTLNKSVKGNKILETVGYLRFFEYEADMAGFFQMSEKSRQTNPRGMISLLEKLRDYEEKHRGKEISWDLAHGDISNRILNLKEMTLVMTLMNFDRPLSPISSAIRDSLPTEKGNRISHLVSPPPSEGRAFDRWRQETKKLIQSADLPLLHIAMKNLISNLSEIRVKLSQVEIKKGVIFDRFDEGLRLLRFMETAWENKLKERYPNLSPSQMLHIKVLALDAAAGLEVAANPNDPIFNQSGISAHFFSLRKTLLTQMDFFNFIKALDSIDIAISKEGLLKLGNSLLFTALNQNAVFDKPDGSIDLEGFFSFSAKFLTLLQQNSEEKGYQRGEDKWSPTFGWNQLIIQTVSFLVEMGQWNDEKNSFFEKIQRAALDSKNTALILAPESFDQSIRALIIRREERNALNEQKVSALKFLAEEAHNNAQSAIIDELIKIKKSLLRIPKGTINDAKKTHHKLLARAVNLFNQLPEVILVSHLKKLESATKEKHSLYSFTLADETVLLSELIQEFSSGLFYSVSQKEKIGPRNLDSALTAIRWHQAVSRSLYDFESYLFSFSFWESNEPAFSGTKEFNALFSSLTRPKEAQTLYGVSRNLSLSKLDLRKKPFWRRGALRAVYNDLKKPGLKSQKSFFRELNQYLKNWSLPPFKDPNGFYKEFEKIKGELLEKGVSFLKLDKKKLSRNDLESLMSLSFLMRDPSLGKNLREYLIFQLLGWEKSRLKPASIKEAIQLTLKKYEAQGFLGGFQFLNELDDRAQTKEEISLLRTTANDFLNGLRESMELTGKAVFGEGFLLKLIDSGNALTLLQALLTSGQNDQQLRDLIGKVWWGVNSLTVEQQVYRTYGVKPEWDSPDDIDKDSIFNDSEFYVAEDSLQFIYQLGPLERLGLLRTLMAGQNGVLGSTDDRKELVETFFSQYVEGNQGADPAFQKLHDIFLSVAQAAPNDELYLILSRLIQDRIAQVPQNPGNFHEQSFEFAKDLLVSVDAARAEQEGAWPPFNLDKLRDIINLKNSGLIHLASVFILETQGKDHWEWEEELGAFKDSLYQRVLLLADEDGSVLHDLGINSSEDVDQESVAGIWEQVEEILTFLNQEKLIPFLEVDTKFNASDILAFDLEADDLLTFYFLELEENYNDIFAEKEQKKKGIYKQFLLELMTPQNKQNKVDEAGINKKIIPDDFNPRETDRYSPLSLIINSAKQLGAPGVRFLQLLGKTIDLPEEYEKEFLTVYDGLKGQSLISADKVIQEEMPDYWEKIIRYQRLGGGSLFTVYKTLLNDGTEEVLRVLNPQAKHHAENFLDVIEKSVETLIEEASSPEEAKQFSQARPVVHLLRKWILEELEDKTFIEDDQRFYARWNSVSLDGFESQIQVPQSFETGSPFIRRETLARGRNFTELDQLSSPLKKNAVAQAIQHYLHQIIDQETNLIHSDVSPGNLQYLENGDIAILDRGMYLKLTSEERALILGLYSVSSNEERAKLFVDWVWGLKDNGKTVKRLNKENVIQSIVDFTQDNAEESSLDILRVVYGFDLSVSLNVMLLFKNINVLDKMAQEAGFSSLKDAIFFKPASSSNPAPASLLYYLTGSVTWGVFGLGLETSLASWLALTTTPNFYFVFLSAFSLVSLIASQKGPLAKTPSIAKVTLGHLVVFGFYGLTSIFSQTYPILLLIPVLAHVSFDFFQMFGLELRKTPSRKIKEKYQRAINNEGQVDKNLIINALFPPIQSLGLETGTQSAEDFFRGRLREEVLHGVDLEEALAALAVLEGANETDLLWGQELMNPIEEFISPSGLLRVMAPGQNVEKELRAMRSFLGNKGLGGLALSKDQASEDVLELAQALNIQLILEEDLTDLSIDVLQARFGSEISSLKVAIDQRARAGLSHTFKETLRRLEKNDQGVHVNVYLTIGDLLGQMALIRLDVSKLLQMDLMKERLLATQA